MTELQIDIARITVIAAVLCVIAVAAAFAGAGLTAFIILAVLVGPISFYANEYIKTLGTGHGAADAPHAHG